MAEKLMANKILNSDRSNSKDPSHNRNCHINPFNTRRLLGGYFCPKYNDVKIFENHLNPVMLVFIAYLSLSREHDSDDRVPMH